MFNFDKFLKIKKDERKKVILLSLFFFFSFLYFTLCDTISTSVFISRVGAGSLYYIYFIISFLLAITALLITKIIGSLNIFRVYGLFSAITIIIHILNYLILLFFADFPQIYFILPIATEINYNFLWISALLIAYSALDIESVKRILPLALASGTLGAICAGAVLSLLSQFLNLETIYLIALSTIFIMFYFSTIIKKQLVVIPGESGDKIGLFSLLSYYKNNKFYIALIFIGILVISTFWMNDYQTNKAIETLIPDERALSSFYGIFEILFNVFLITFEALILGRIIKKLGALKIAYLVIFAITLGNIFILSADNITTITISKLIFAIFVAVISSEIFQFYYQPIETKYKNSIVVNAQFFIKSGALFVGGFFTLISSLDIIKTKYLTLISLIISILLLILWIFMNKSFLKIIKHTIESLNPEKIKALSEIDISHFIYSNLNDEHFKIALGRNELVLDLVKYSDSDYKDKIIQKIFDISDISFKLKLIDCIFENYFSYSYLKTIVELKSSKITEYLVYAALLNKNNFKDKDLLLYILRTINENNYKFENASATLILNFLNENNEPFYHKILNNLYESKEDNNIKKALDIIDNYPEYEDINEIFFDQITRHYSINDDIFKLIVTNNHFFIKPKYIVQYSLFYYNYYKLSLISDKCKVHLKYLNEINAINANVYLLQILSQGARGDMEEYLYKIDDVLNYLILLDVEIVKISEINSKYKNILLQEAEIIKKAYLVVIIKFLLKYKNYPEPKLYDYLYSQYLSEFLENSIPAKYYNKIRSLIERNTAVKYNILETDGATDAVESSNYDILDVGLSTNVLKDIYKYLKGESMSADIKEKLEKILTLKTIPMFESLDINNIMQISEITKYKDFDEKETVMREGESSDNFYIVVEGKVDVIRNNIKLNEVGAGSILGELGVIDDDVRTATIITKEKTTLLALDGKDFIDLLHKNATISYSVIKTLTSRLRGMIEMKTK